MSRNLFIVDDDDAVRNSLFQLLSRRSSYSIRAFRSGTEFLTAHSLLNPGVVLLDYRMAGANGLAVLDTLRGCSERFVSVMLTAHGAVQRSVDAMKGGAFDFLEKPCDPEALLSVLDSAFQHLDAVQARCAVRDAARHQLSVLTPREQQVLDGLVNGQANKQIAWELAISPRTVEVHRANVMLKLKANTLADVLQIVFAAEPARAA